MNQLPESLRRVIDANPILENFVRGLPDLGTRLDGAEFSPEVKKIHDVFSIYGNGLYELLNDKIRNIPSKSLGGGSPMKTPIFPPAKRKLIETINLDDMSEYPMAAGDDESKKEIVEYLIKEGFKCNDRINEDNLIFTISTTHAFSIICQIIGRPYDVVLMTGPNYGLFTFVPERSNNLNIEILPLSENDNWYINPEKLDLRIREINDDLRKRYEGKLPYIPKVVAFLNENPHNPLGKVINAKNKEILEGIGNVCLKNGVFVIDDLIYRDLTYDRENLALPMGTYKEYFDNTISLFGLSKGYGLASIRAGMVVANPVIIRGIRNYIFQNMDSSPILQAKALTGAFNASDERYKEYDNYFNPIIEEYKYRLELLKTLVNGLDSIEDLTLRMRIESDIRKLINSDLNVEEVLEGIPNVGFVNGTMPESGFFALLDFTRLKNKASDKRVITDEVELLKYMYETEKIKLILGQSISYPNSKQLVGRVTTAIERDDLINHMGAMNKTLRKLR
ncbi:MAG: pyridoxal phosphate-dependent aminotransferase [Bacilli bacterium]|nr:pyridoxal phosphate-dependent aminotransferase [Bacilli bacterium]